MGNRRYAKDSKRRARHRRTVLRRYGWKCHICGGWIEQSVPKDHPESLTFDHVVPLSKGGSRGSSNLRPAHRICNTRKGNR
jgi:5-methylcytosine-specific restriction endonuclease McrA